MKHKLPRVFSVEAYRMCIISSAWSRDNTHEVPIREFCLNHGVEGSLWELVMYLAPSASHIQNPRLPEGKQTLSINYIVA